ncbi:MAG: DsrE family protein [Planctomycetota bacterium]
MEHRQFGAGLRLRRDDLPRCLGRGLGPQGRSRRCAPEPARSPIGTMVENLMAGGAAVLACPPCAKVRGYGADDLLDGVTLAGAPAMLERVKAGASTLSF